MQNSPKNIKFNLWYSNRKKIDFNFINFKITIRQR